MEALWTLIIFIALAMVGFPIAIAIGLATFVFAVLLGVPFTIIPQTLFTSLDSFSYITIPLFILVGNLMETGKEGTACVGFQSGFLAGSIAYGQ